MNFLKKNLNGILVCFVIAVPSWLLGKTFPVVGGPVIAILAGMLITLVWTNKGKAESGIKWTSKIILQTAVVLLGFGMNLGVILQTGKQSLPIIVCTISTSLIIAWLLRKIIKVPSNTSILVGVGSSICGGSAIAATAPVIDADDTEVAQAISVIFFFNVIAAVLFPVLGSALGFDTTGGGSFGLFAGTAINDTRKYPFGFETDRGYDRILRRYFRRNFIGGRDGNPIYDIDSIGEKPLYGTCRGIHRARW